MSNMIIFEIQKGRTFLSFSFNNDILRLCTILVNIAIRIRVYPNSCLNKEKLTVGGSLKK